jgi:hypothetical protein
VVTAILTYIYFKTRHKHLTNIHAQRIAARIEVFVAGAILWPALVIYFCSPVLSQGKELYFLTGVIVLAYLTQEVGAVHTFCGPVIEFDNSSDMFYQRAVQVSTVAFAIGTILMSQANAQLAKKVTPLLFLGLILCLFAIVPTASARNRPDASPALNAIQRLTISYSAGILCLVISYCLTLKDLRLD